MWSRAKIYDRAAVLGQRVQVLVWQLAEFHDLRDRVLRTEQTTMGTRRLIGRIDLAREGVVTISSNAW